MLGIVLLFGAGVSLSQEGGAPPTPYLVKESTLPRGNAGIAARYPGDAGIEKDADVVFHDDFESGNLDKWTPGWRSDRGSITDEGAHAGKRGMKWTAIKREESDEGGNMGAKLDPGLDLCFYRVYCRVPEDFSASRMHGWSITATAPGVSALGGAGRKPTGKDKFTLTLDMPHDNMSLYTYYPDMPGGWGTSFRTGFSMEKGKWTCIELMLKANEVGKRDGEIAAWGDGKLLGHWAGFRYRDIPELKIGMAHLVFYLHQKNPAGSYGMFHDDVVVAKKYIGPMVP